MAFANIYTGKRVLVTGHTGFKGSWLCEWLLALGADVTGFALRPPTQPALFEELGLADRVNHIEGDVRDAAAVQRAISETKPDIVFHLAAQPIVRLSYAEPVRTIATNVMGTVNVLEALRQAARPCVLVAITTDKCYENVEWVHSYREEDPMGGHDPYSASKGAAELLIHAYRRSYFSKSDSPVKVASVRAGNVIGGGDWAPDRIVPDCMRALEHGNTIHVRSKTATRPWQHVLEPLSGYLWLGACLAASHKRLAQSGPTLAELGIGAAASIDQFDGGFNFGPALSSNRSVAQLVTEILKHWPGEWQDDSNPSLHEANLLNLATDKAFHLLGWKPVWNFERTIAQTVTWYRQQSGGLTEVAELTRGQIAEYTADAAAKGIAWAGDKPEVVPDEAAARSPENMLASLAAGIGTFGASVVGALSEVPSALLACAAL